MRTKQIIGKLPTRRNNDHRLGSECMYLVVDEMSKFFKTCWSHGAFNNCSGLVSSSVRLLYPENTFSCYSSIFLNIEIMDTINIVISDDIDREFFDNHITIIHSDNDKLQVIRIMVNDRFAGYYAPSINSLFATDWTHNHNTVSIFNQIWPILVKNFGLVPKYENVNTIEINEILVGCDPEFELIDEYGMVTNAQDVIDDEDKENAIGLDGSCDQVEIRPKPGSPAKVTRSIKKLISEFAEDYSEYDLSDEGNVYPLGGHIHIGIGFEYMPTSDLVELLDDFVGRPTLILSGEARGEYTELSAVRTQPHGFEYRSTPAAIFNNPKITYCALRLMKNLCKKYFNGEEIEYSINSVMPSIEDYVVVGGLTEKMAKYFVSFCENDFKPTRSIRASWKITPLEIKKREIEESDVVVQFKDYWATDVERKIRSKILDMAFEKSIRIVFYGLRSSRGDDMCSIEVFPILDEIEDSLPYSLWQGSYEENNRTLHIGISRNRRERSTMNDEFVTTLTNIIKDEIESDIARSH